MVTDHLDLKSMRKKTELAAQLQSFADRFFNYDYNVVYRPGKNCFAPDLLSRALLFVSTGVKRLMLRDQTGGGADLPLDATNFPHPSVDGPLLSA